MYGASPSCIRETQEIKFGRFSFQFPLFGVPITLPDWVFDWTMALLPDGSWDRRSRTFGMDAPDANYYLRLVVDGGGRPGKYYDDWVKARGGTPIQVVAEQIA